MEEMSSKPHCVAGPKPRYGPSHPLVGARHLPRHSSQLPRHSHRHFIEHLSCTIPSHPIRQDPEAPRHR
ncbi:hypothetical protein M0R45_004237 [Rubus argutus]|uniref:Uncharacterized protein n=1 Tax=Rubus argutus TaxID=59490 RepID=A0AAW1YJ81_RUBAR